MLKREQKRFAGDLTIRVTAYVTAAKWLYRYNVNRGYRNGDHI